MHLQLLVTASEVAVSEFHVVGFISDLTQEIDAVELVENFDSDAVAWDAGLGVVGAEVGGGHLDFGELFVGDYLVANCILLVLDHRFRR